MSFKLSCQPNRASCRAHGTNIMANEGTYRSVVRDAQDIVYCFEVGETIGSGSVTSVRGWRAPPNRMAVSASRADQTTRPRLLWSWVLSGGSSDPVFSK